MRVALVRVLALLQRDLPRLIALEGDGGRLVEAGALEVEVVEGRLVLDLDRVRAGLQRLHVLAVHLDLDREAGTNFADEALRLGGCSCRQCHGRSYEREQREYGDCHVSRTGGSRARIRRLTRFSGTTRLRRRRRADPRAARGARGAS